MFLRAAPRRWAKADVAELMMVPGELADLGLESQVNSAKGLCRLLPMLFSFLCGSRREVLSPLAAQPV
jgi:hypothetical protein